MNANEIIELLFNKENHTKFNPDLDAALSEARSRQVAAAQESLIKILQTGMARVQDGHKVMINELVIIRKQIRQLEKRQKEFAKKRDAMRWILDNPGLLNNQQAVMLFDDENLMQGLVSFNTATELGIHKKDIPSGVCNITQVVEHIQKQLEEDENED
jgi:hypothetical protein